MRNALRLMLAGALAGPALALAQASMQLRVELPVVLPRLVVVAPGVQVVPDYEEEVFFSDGWYWVRQDAGWYRSRSHRGGWLLVPPRRVPRRLVGMPPGKYRHWRPAAPPPRAAPSRWRPAAPAPRPAPAVWRGDGGARGHDERGGHDRGGERGHERRGDGHGDGRGDRKGHRGDRD